MRRAVGLVLLFGVAAAGGDGWDASARITIRDKKISVQDAVLKICRQAKQEVVTTDKPDYQIALELEQVTFLEALDEVARRAGLALSFGRGIRLVELPEDMQRVPAWHAGPLRIEVLGVYSARSGARLFSPDARRTARDTARLWTVLRLVPEPGLSGIHVGPIELTHVNDDADRSLIQSRELSPVSLMTPLQVDLKVIGRGSLKIQEFRGKLAVYLVRKTEEVKIGAGARKSKRRLGGATFVLRKLERTGAMDRARMEVGLEGKPCQDVREKAVFRVLTASYGRSRGQPGLAPNVVAIFAYDRAGKTIGGRVFSFQREKENLATVNLDRYPARVEIKAVTEADRREVDFRFRDLPIPR